MQFQLPCSCNILRESTFQVIVVLLQQVQLFALLPWPLHLLWLLPWLLSSTYLGSTHLLRFQHFHSLLLLFWDDLYFKYIYTLGLFQIFDQEYVLQEYLSADILFSFFTYVCKVYFLEVYLLVQKWWVLHFFLFIVVKLLAASCSSFFLDGLNE